MAQTRHSTGRQLRLVSGPAAKRWGRWFLFAWIGMWLGTALLPCCEVAAAVSAHEQSMQANCGHAPDQAPDSGGSHKSGACLDIAAPAPAVSLATLDGVNPVQPAMLIFSSLVALSPPPAPSLPVAYRAAPPPVAVFLRSSRLLI